MDYRIKPHAPPFEQVPASSVKFLTCGVTTQAEYFCVNLVLNTHLLQYRLLGLKCLFITYTFVIERHFLIVSRFRVECSCKLPVFYH